MKRADLMASGVLPGAVGGVAGGIVFGAAMLDLGVLSSVASIVGVESAVVGFIVHMAIAATVGAGLGVLVWHQRPGTGETLLWGLAYGTLWWFIGTLTLHPLLLGNTLAWDAESARAALPALLGHVLFGASAGLVISLVRLRYRGGEDSMLITASALIRGGTAGLVAVWIIGTVLAAQGQLHSFVAVTPQDSGLTVWLTTLLVGLLAGVGFAILYPSAADSAGVGLVRGGMYGFLWWVAVPLSVLPALHGSGLPWQVDQVRAVFPTLPGCILFGATTALLYHWLGVVTRVLFSDIVAGADSEGVGSGWPCVHRCHGSDRGLCQRGRSGTGRIQRVRLLRPSDHRQHCRGQLWAAIPASEPRHGFRAGLGSLLWVHLVGHRLLDPVPSPPRSDSPMDCGCRRHSVPSSDRPPYIRCKLRGHLLSPGGSLPAMVDSSRSGAGATGGIPQGAALDIRARAVDSGCHHLPDAARSTRFQRT